MSNGVFSKRFDVYKSHGRTKLEEFTNESVKAKQDNEDYESPDFSRQNNFQLKQLNEELQRLSKKFNELCQASENAQDLGYGDNNYNVGGNYYQTQAAETVNNINKISKESEQ